jgi:hypothetical protein
MTGGVGERLRGLKERLDRLRPLNPQSLDHHLAMLERLTPPCAG